MNKILLSVIATIITFTVNANNYVLRTDSVIDEVTATATRTHVASERLRVINVISKVDIAQMPHTSLDQILDNLPGIDVRSRGSNGVQSDISMRGGTFDQVVILLNGINITDPQTGHLNLELPLDISTIDRIEILQGTSMSIFGLSSFSGAINIITGENNPTKGKYGTFASITGGDHGLLKATIATKQYSDKWTISANATYHQSSGYMDNTDYQHGSVFLHAACKDSITGNWGLQIGGQLKGFGANSFYSLAYPNQYEATKMGFASLSWDKRIGSFGIEANIYHRTLQDRFELIRDYKDAPSWYTFHNHHLSNVSGVNIKGAWFSSIGKTSAGIELRNESILSNVLGDKLENTSSVPFENDSTLFSHGKNRLNINYFVEQHFYVERLSASVGVSGNYNSMFSNNFAFGANIGYEYQPNSNIFASFNRALRLPTFTDLYYQSATQIANHDLLPEESYTAEIGINYRYKNFSTSLSAYYRWGKNIIDWIKLPSEEKWRSMNHSDVDAMGGEITATYSYGYWLKKISATYSLCHLNKETNGYISKYALDYLRHKFTAQLSHGIYRGFGATWTANFQSRNGEYIDVAGNTQSYAPVFTLDGRIYWQNSRMQVYVEASNITNTRYYDYGGILQAPIWAKGGISVNI